MHTVRAIPAPFPSSLPSGMSRMDVLPLGVTRSFAKDEQVYSEGDPIAHCYKVESGAVRVCKLLSDGRRQIIGFYLPGEFFGIEMGNEHGFDAEAVADTTVIVYKRRASEALATGGELADRIMEAMMATLERAQSHMLLLGRKSALEKIAEFLLDMAERTGDEEPIELPMCRADIADYLGLTIETVSRSLTQLERKSIISVPKGRRSITLQDRAALRGLDA